MKLELAYCPKCDWTVAAPYGDKPHIIPDKCPKCKEWTTLVYR